MPEVPESGSYAEWLSRVAEHSLADDMLAELEARRAQFRNLPVERKLSVNDWVGNVREACASAHSAARTGLLDLEVSSWIDVAAYALGRAEVVREIENRERASGANEG